MQLRRTEEQNVQKIYPGLPEEQHIQELVYGVRRWRQTKSNHPATEALLQTTSNRFILKQALKQHRLFPKWSGLPTA